MGTLNKITFPAKTAFESFKIFNKLSGVTRYYSIITTLFLLKNIRGIVQLLKEDLVGVQGLSSQIFVGFLTVFKFLAKKALFFDVGIYEGINILQLGGLSALEHLNILTDILLGVLLVGVVLYTMVKVTSFIHNDVVGLGSVITGFLIFFFAMGYFGIKLTDNIDYRPFEGLYSFGKVIWADPNILIPSTENGIF
jgi:hypothetical protein